MEGILDRTFFQHLPQLKKDSFDFPKSEDIGGRERAKDYLAAVVRTWATEAKKAQKVAICLDIDTGSPQATFEEVEDHLTKGGLAVQQRDIAAGKIVAGPSEVLVIPMGLYQDEDLNTLKVVKHEKEDYLVKIALAVPGLKLTSVTLPLKECLKQVVSTYTKKGVSSFSSKELYQFLKPLLGLPPHETRAIITLLEKATPDTVQGVTGPLVTKLNQFVAGDEGVA